jgi:hypothetical protein
MKFSGPLHEQPLVGMAHFGGTSVDARKYCYLNKIAVAVGAVIREPLSPLISLLFAHFQGISAHFRLSVAPMPLNSRDIPQPALFQKTGEEQGNNRHGMARAQASI